MTLVMMTAPYSLHCRGYYTHDYAYKFRSVTVRRRFRLVVRQSGFQRGNVVSSARAVNSAVRDSLIGGGGGSGVTRCDVMISGDGGAGGDEAEECLDWTRRPITDGHGLGPSMRWVGSNLPAHVMGWVGWIE